LEFGFMEINIIKKKKKLEELMLHFAYMIKIKRVQC